MKSSMYLVVLLGLMVICSEVSSICRFNMPVNKGNEILNARASFICRFNKPVNKRNEILNARARNQALERFKMELDNLEQDNFDAMEKKQLLPAMSTEIPNYVPN